MIPPMNGESRRRNFGRSHGFIWHMTGAADSCLSRRSFANPDAAVALCSRYQETVDSLATIVPHRYWHPY